MVPVVESLSDEVTGCLPPHNSLLPICVFTFPMFPLPPFIVYFLFWSCVCSVTQVGIMSTEWYLNVMKGVGFRLNVTSYIYMYSIYIYDFLRAPEVSENKF